ncbi:SixA phosphatase family protein [Rufibacter psychrotolerans]|uniref:SixA phosphatase family protein n=1 Tax=Rufibacter psychrotolerans TaxID=2812556 RepID=UPI001967C20A|nr:histidine phosphatase family protein [Rufibacter sp. SYSU D00308]
MNLPKSFLVLLGCCLLLVAAVMAKSKNSVTPPAWEGTERKGPGKTVVYLVRHAEKASAQTMMSSAAMAEDPELSPAGQERAQALKAKLGKKRPAALFATPYRRTRQTLQPLAEATNLEIHPYDARNGQALAQKIRQEYAGKTVVVAGHSNTVLPLLEALGGTKPFPEIADHHYDYLFKVTLQENKPTKVEVATYGKPSVAPVH